MKICLICGRFPGMHCGVGDYCAQLAVRLVKRGVRVSVLTSSHPKIAEKKGDYSNTGLEILDIIQRWDFLRLSRLTGIIDDIQPNIIHIQYQTGTFGRKAGVNFLPILVKRHYDPCPIVTTFHDCATPYVFPRGPNRLRRSTLLPLLRFSDRVVISNNRDRRRLSTLCPAVRTRMAQIPVGSNIVFDPQVNCEVTELRKEIGIEAEQYLVSCFGFVRDDRDNELLLNAIKMLAADGFQLKLAFVGGVEKSSKAYRNLLNTIETVGLSGNVLFTGYLAPRLVSKFLRASDVHVFCHRDGVTSARCSLITAVSHGVPTIALSLGDEPGYFIDHDNIVLSPPRDVEALFSSLKELLLSPSLRKKLSRNALVLAKRFSWETIVGKHLTVYKQVLSANPSVGKR